ncbi:MULTISPECIES: hypothetical protein [Alkalihalophilus]|nr:hypothetical protein [Alkalihalophilus marmarensis]MEC2071850.1 hypothetical protein [Alkalihalophilus marmarensis]
MLKGIDLQMVAFVGASLLLEYVPFFHIPKLYYFTPKTDKEDDDRAA